MLYIFYLLGGIAARDREKALPIRDALGQGSSGRGRSLSTCNSSYESKAHDSNPPSPESVCDLEDSKCYINTFLP